MTDRRRQVSSVSPSKSRALTVVERDSHASKGLAGNDKIRNSSAFLAHLAQQYDGVAARKTQRTNRLDTAITRYGTEMRARTVPQARSAHDLKV